MGESSLILIVIPLALFTWLALPLIVDSGSGARHHRGQPTPPPDIATWEPSSTSATSARRPTDQLIRQLQALGHTVTLAPAA